MPKNITGSVGRGGRNFPANDVITVQYLLNCVPAAQGGPSKELVVDGAAGPKTIAAIESFQRRHGGVADGRVDPGGATLRALQARDPLPNQPIPGNAAKSGGGGKEANGKQWGGAPGGKDAFGNKTSQSSTKTGVDPFGNKTTQTPGKTGVDPYGTKTVGGPVTSFPDVCKNFPPNQGSGMIN